MTTVTRADLRVLITSAQGAVRAVEDRGSRKTIAALRDALLPMYTRRGEGPHRQAFMDALGEAELSLRAAAASGTWDLLTDVEQTVSRFWHEPDGATLDHPALQAITTLTVRFETDDRSIFGAANERAHYAGLDAMRALSSAINGAANGRQLDKAVTEFLAAVRRAIPYMALYDTRRALVEAAWAYGLFPVGMRQPESPESLWDWSREIGGALHLFELVGPGIEGHPFGAVATVRFVDGLGGGVRYFPLSSIEEWRRIARTVVDRV